MVLFAGQLEGELAKWDCLCLGSEVWQQPRARVVGAWGVVGAFNVHLVHSNPPRLISSLGSVSRAWEVWTLPTPGPEVWQRARWWWWWSADTGVCEWVSGGGGGWGVEPVPSGRTTGHQCWCIFSSVLPWTLKYINTDREIANTPELPNSKYICVGGSEISLEPGSVAILVR